MNQTLCFCVLPLVLMTQTFAHADATKTLAQRKPASLTCQGVAERFAMRSANESYDGPYKCALQSTAPVSSQSSVQVEVYSIHTRWIAPGAEALTDAWTIAVPLQSGSCGQPVSR